MAYQDDFYRMLEILSTVPIVKPGPVPLGGVRTGFPGPLPQERLRAAALEPPPMTEPRPSPPPPSIVPSDVVPGEFAGMAPQESLPDDFFARLLEARGLQPFRFRPRSNKGLDALLAGLAGFANARTRGKAVEVGRIEERNERAREAAKTLATWRHQERVREAERLGERSERVAREQAAERRAEKRDAPEAVEERAFREGRGYARGRATAGAPLGARPAARAKPGPVMPELSTLASRFGREAQDARTMGNQAKADSLRGLQSLVDRIHSDIRQAQSVDDLRAIQFPSGLPDEVRETLKKATRNRERMLANPR